MVCVPHDGETITDSVTNIGRFGNNCVKSSAMALLRIQSSLGAPFGRHYPAEESRRGKSAGLTIWGGRVESPCSGGPFVRLEMQVERWQSGLTRTPGERECLKSTGGSNPPLSASCLFATQMPLLWLTPPGRSPVAPKSTRPPSHTFPPPGFPARVPVSSSGLRTRFEAGCSTSPQPGNRPPSPFRWFDVKCLRADHVV